MNMQLKTVKFYLIHFIIATITLACFLMNQFLRQGLPLNNTLEQRLLFIANNETVWVVSWCVWMLAALGLFTFCAILADELQKTFLRTVGLSIVAIGIAPDLIAEVIYAFVMPHAIQQKIDISIIHTLEIFATFLTGYLGNGLYNLGGLILILLAIKERVIKSWIAAWGVIAWVLGLMLSVAIAMRAMQMAEIFTATSMVLSTAWMLIFAYKVLKH